MKLRLKFTDGIPTIELWLEPLIVKDKHIYFMYIFFLLQNLRHTVIDFLGGDFTRLTLTSSSLDQQKKQLWFGILVHSLESTAITEQKITASKTSMTHILSTTRAYHFENCVRSSVESAILMVYVGHFNNIFPYIHSAKVSNEHVFAKTLLRPKF